MLNYNTNNHYYVYDKWQYIKTIDLSVYRTSSDPLCPIKEWTLYVKDAAGNYIPYVNNLNEAYHDAPYFLKVNTTTSFRRQFYIKSQSVTDHSTNDIEVYDPLFVKVCGLENVKTTLGYDPTYFFYWNTGTKQATNNLVSWFYNDD